MPVPDNSKCPFPSAVRKTAADPTPDRSADEPTVARGPDGTWTVRGYDVVKQVLRSGATQQAGFQADSLRETMSFMRDPMLYLEGEDHRALRTETARFFTPKAVSNYDGMIEAYVKMLLDELESSERLDLSDLSLKLAVRVAAEVIGLTNSSMDGLSRRLEAFFEAEPATALEWSVDSIRGLLTGQYNTARFFLRDVRPAIRARRREPKEDLITHLIGRDYSSLEILTECVTFAAAGMVTTREFISVAAWHFLSNDDLRARYLAADRDERHAMLHEILRLEPVVGELYRRTTAELTIDLPDGPTTIPADELIELDIYAANVDPEVVGSPEDVVWPSRDLPKGVQAAGMSFGDGNHRCPGAYIAIEESDIFLSNLLAIEDLRVERHPTLTRNALVKGYELRDFVLSVG